ncbi:zinc carboxypeptidase-like [Thrips palmi]|uniref:Zinc carboxypeptidase-like n=1 Tax=Thrips palmi TaxID=161013 RepID=A0A6P8Y914_THRPL|nr:zinc carboxypeptidase-like [Thrips palmi]
MARQLALLCLLAAVVAADVKQAVVEPVDAKQAVVEPVDAKQAVVDVKRALEAAQARVQDQAPVVRYDNHIVAKVVPSTQQQLDDLHAFFRVNGEIDVWKAPTKVGREVHFLASPDEYRWVTSALGEKGLKPEVIVSDVQRIIDNQTASITRAGDVFGWENYHRLSSMYSWMQSLVSHFPGVASLVDGGLSHEGRHMLGVRVAHAEGLPIVFLEAGIHAREWIGPATATYILHQLLMSADPRVQRVARSFEWHVFPSVNPDAYEYSHTTERLWRKSRRRFSFGCFGADLNRNFPYNWGTAGVSWNACSDIFPGSGAASEVETRYRIKYMEPLLPRMKAFIALHSYGQLLIFPWGDTTSKAANFDALAEVGTKAAEAYSSRYGTDVTLGNLATVLYPASGSSMDWAYSQGVPFAFTYELRPGHQSVDPRTGVGFLLPADLILPAAEETTDSVVAMLNAILDKW